MAKNNIRSIRFSDELADIIDRQIGETFTQKFESLIYRAFYELPAKEKELEQINQRIQDRVERLQYLQKATNEIFALERAIESVKRDLAQVKQHTKTIAEEVKKAEV